MSQLRDQGRISVLEGSRPKGEEWLVGVRW